MRHQYHLVLLAAFAACLCAWVNNSDEWIEEKHKEYSLHYDKIDKDNIKEYKTIVDNGVIAVREFFGGSFKSRFDIFIHPNRQSLDNQWRKDWNMPDFKSECWMVASGVAKKLDAISPKVWDTQACEHKYSDKMKTQQLITHELVHVYHGQSNVSPDFSDVNGIDWFVEGLATYASGQCDSVKMVEIKKASSENKIPMELDKFWTGKLKYGLSGSMVMYIDKKYGRNKLKELLKYNKKIDILSSLNITEADLLAQWKTYVDK